MFMAENSRGQHFDDVNEEKNRKESSIAETPKEEGTVTNQQVSSSRGSSNIDSSSSGAGKGLGITTNKSISEMDDDHTSL